MRNLKPGRTNPNVPFSAKGAFSSLNSGKQGPATL